MKEVCLVNQTQSKVLCSRCAVADNLLTRVRGLLGRNGLAEDEGLLIVPCPSIHMFGMKFSLDVVFLSRDNMVIDWVENIAPGKIYVAKTPPLADAGQDAKAWKRTYTPHAAIELPVGAIARHGLHLFDRIAIERRL